MRWDLSIFKGQTKLVSAQRCNQPTDQPTKQPPKYSAYPDFFNQWLDLGELENLEFGKYIGLLVKKPDSQAARRPFPMELRQ